MDNVPTTEYLSIGELAQLAAVSNRTILYYEQLGILPEPGRSTGGMRKYPPEYVLYVWGALALKKLGFSLDEIKVLGALALRHPLSVKQQAWTDEILVEKLGDLEHWINVLCKLEDVLSDGSDRAKELRELLRPRRPNPGAASRR